LGGCTRKVRRIETGDKKHPSARGWGREMELYLSQKESGTNLLKRKRGIAEGGRGGRRGRGGREKNGGRFEEDTKDKSVYHSL